MNLPQSWAYAIYDKYELMNKKLLIIGHCPSENTKVLFDALAQGAEECKGTSVDVSAMSPFDCNSELVLEADALILFTTENFGYMSGALKDFFERIYYPCLNNPKQCDAKPYSLVIRAGLDGTGTLNSVTKIVKALQWKTVSKVLLCKGDFQFTFIDDCRTLGGTIAASLDSELI